MLPKIKKGVLLCSGGLDSVILLHEYKDYISHVLHINYNQNNYKSERNSVEYFCEKLNKFLLSYSFNIPFIKSGLLVNGSGYSYELKARNLLFSIFGMYAALEYNLEAVYMGVYIDDNYFDTTERGVRLLQAEVLANSGGKVTLELPYLKLDKYLIYKKGLELGVELDKTHTCFYESVCGVCPACNLRKDVENTVKVLIKDNLI